ncbi:MAG TPA: hypothetical protein VLC12_07010 [Terriglobales bacterium]|nr:hypothetical protein [Terriglobales bacterium]
MTYTERFLVLAAVVALACGFAASQTVTTIKIAEDQPALEFVGQFNNAGLSSVQFGYISDIRGFDLVFNGTPENESTANFTFVTNATTNVVFVNGPFRTINRTGTTTVYLNNGPASFNDPATFGQGTPIQVSDYTQQVVLNTLTGAFSTVHLNTVTQASPFTLGTTTYRLGQVGKSFRTTYSGQANTGGTSPGGWFSGYAVGVK